MSRLLSGSGGAGNDGSEMDPSRQQIEKSGYAMLLLELLSSQKQMALQKVQEAEKGRSV